MGGGTDNGAEEDAAVDVNIVDAAGGADVEEFDEDIEDEDDDADAEDRALSARARARSCASGVNSEDVLSGDEEGDEEDGDDEEMFTAIAA
jgi:hypothetical protein